MHILLALLSAIISIFYILDRLGIDIGGINPFAWRRRRAWAKRYQGDPIYAIEDPMETAAVFVIGTARLGGELSAEQKQMTLSQFQEIFSIDAKAASELYASTSYLLGAPQLIESQLEGLAKRCENRFTATQAQSVLDMVQRVAATGQTLTEHQQATVDILRAALLTGPTANSEWSS